MDYRKRKINSFENELNSKKRKINSSFTIAYGKRKSIKIFVVMKNIEN